MRETYAAPHLHILAAAHGLQRQVVGLQSLRDGVVHHHLQHARLLGADDSTNVQLLRYFCDSLICHTSQLCQLCLIMRCTKPSMVV